MRPSTLRRTIVAVAAAAPGGPAASAPANWSFIHLPASEGREPEADAGSNRVQHHVGVCDPALPDWPLPKPSLVEGYVRLPALLELKGPTTDQVGFALVANE